MARTQEARAMEGLAITLRDLLKHAEDEGMSVCDDAPARKALRKLQEDIRGWGFVTN